MEPTEAVAKPAEQVSNSDTKSLIEQLKKEVVTVQDYVKSNTDESKKGLDSYQKEVKEKMDTVNADLMEKYQALQCELKSQKEAQEKFEANMSRSNSSSSVTDNKLKDYNDAYSNYIRYGIEPDAEVLKKSISGIVEKKYSYESDSEKAKINSQFFEQMGGGKGMLAFDSKTLSVDSDPDGGYTVENDRRPGVQSVRLFETSPIRELATVISTNKEAVQFVMDDDESVSGGWVSEQQARPKTGTSKFFTKTITAHEQYANVPLTQKILDDSSINIQQYSATKTVDIFGRTANTTFVVGDGASKARGFLDYPNTAVAGEYERNKIEQIKSGTLGKFETDTIKELQNSLKEIYQPAAVWLMKRRTWTEITTLKNGTGDYLLNRNSFKEGDSKILLGNRVVLADDMPAQADNALSLAYGDFGRGYTIVDRFGIRVIRDDVTEKPLVLFYSTQRVGGDVTNYEAIKLYKLAA